MNKNTALCRKTKAASSPHHPADIATCSHSKCKVSVQQQHVVFQKRAFLVIGVVQVHEPLAMTIGQGT